MADRDLAGWTPADTGTCDQCAGAYQVGGTDLRHYQWAASMTRDLAGRVDHQWLCRSCAADLDRIVRSGCATFVRVPGAVTGF